MIVHPHGSAADLGGFTLELAICVSGFSAIGNFHAYATDIVRHGNDHTTDVTLSGRFVNC